MAKIKLGKKEGWDIPIVGFKPEDAGITKEQATKFDQFLAYLGGTTGIGLNCNCHVSFWGSLQVVGGNGGASTGNGEWTGGINVYGAYAGFINFCTNSVNYHPDYN